MSKELKEIYKKLLEIQEIYYKANPQGDYLSMCIMRDYISINNEYWDKDKEYPISIIRLKERNYD